MPPDAQTPSLRIIHPKQRPSVSQNDCFTRKKNLLPDCHVRRHSVWHISAVGFKQQLALSDSLCLCRCFYSLTLARSRGTHGSREAAGVCSHRHASTMPASRAQRPRHAAAHHQLIPGAIEVQCLAYVACAQRLGHAASCSQAGVLTVCTPTGIPILRSQDSLRAHMRTRRSGLFFLKQCARKLHTAHKPRCASCLRIPARLARKTATTCCRIPPADSRSSRSPVP